MALLLLLFLVDVPAAGRATTTGQPLASVGAAAPAGQHGDAVEVARFEVPDEPSTMLLRAPAGTAYEVKFRTDGRWSEPLDLEAAPTEGPDGLPTDAMMAVGPIRVDDGADQVQIGRVAGPDAAIEPTFLVDVEPEPVTADADAPQVAGSQQVALGERPAIMPRSAWAADGWAYDTPGCQNGPSYADNVQAVVVHHTVTSNNYAQDEVDDLLRAIYHAHVRVNGWCDIGYNFVVDRFGTIWEARTGGVDQPVIGGHAKGFNSGTAGIAFLGQHHHRSEPPGHRAQRLGRGGARGARRLEAPPPRGRPNRLDVAEEPLLVGTPAARERRVAPRAHRSRPPRPRHHVVPRQPRAGGRPSTPWPAGTEPPRPDPVPVGRLEAGRDRRRLRRGRRSRPSPSRRFSHPARDRCPGRRRRSSDGQRHRASGRRPPQWPARLRYILTADGGLTPFGGTPAVSAPALAASAVDLSLGRSGGWVVTADGSVAGFGGVAAPAVASGSAGPIVAADIDQDGNGYLLESGGGLRAVGSAPAAVVRSANGPLGIAAVDVAVRPGSAGGDWGAGWWMRTGTSTRSELRLLRS